MHWGNPQALWFLFAVPLLVLLGWQTLRWRERAARALGDPQLLDRLYPLSVRRWRRRRLMVLLVAIILLILASARPQYGKIEQSFKTYGTHAMVALDCSPSMLADDVNPNRFERAKYALGNFLRKMAGNDVGVIAFAGDAYLYCPMTNDATLAKTILDAIDPEAVQPAGTDLGRVLELAISSFERGTEDISGRALVLITDGEDNEEGALLAAKRAAEKNIRVYGIGVGTEGGSPLERAGGGFIENEAGRKVNSRLRMDTLEAIAQLTGGKAIAAGNQPTVAVQSIVEAIMQNERVELESRKQTIYIDRFQWFLIPALVLLMLVIASRPEQTHVQAPLTRKEAGERAA